MTVPELILHVGAPKCGSSALQTALTASPDLTDGDGRRYRYTVCRPVGGIGNVFHGADVSLIGRGSPYGYGSWPNLKPGETDSPIFPALDRVRRRGLREGHVPIASCEGWIGRPDLFAAQLARWGHPPVEVVAFLRPPVEWVNAAFWQWGIWNVGTLDAWMQRGNLKYTFGLDLEAWSRIPNVTLRIARSRPDAVRRFAGFYDLDLPGIATSNAAASPALVGLMLRNRRFRPSGHECSVEFVVQRWCPRIEGRKLWAVRGPHLRALRETVRLNREALERVAAPGELADLHRDPRWLREKPYHAAIQAGPPPLDDRAEMAGLLAALCEGGKQAAETAGMAVPPAPACPPESAGIEVWDAALAASLDALLAADRQVRRQAGRQGPSGLRARALRLRQRFLTK